MAQYDIANFSSGTTASGGLNNTTNPITLTLAAGTLPVKTNGFPVVIYDATSYPNPGDDPNVEIAMVTASDGSEITMTRAAAVAHAGVATVARNWTAEDVDQIYADIAAAGSSPSTIGEHVTAVQQQIVAYIVGTMDLASPVFQQFTSGTIVGILWGRKTNDGSFHEDGTYTVGVGKTASFILLSGTNVQPAAPSSFASQMQKNGGSCLDPAAFANGVIMLGTGNTASTNPLDTAVAGDVLSFQTKSTNAPIYAWIIFEVA